MEIDGVEGIEVVRGQAAVARYGDDASGGVVLVSLKRAPDASRQATAWGVSPAWTEASYTVAPRIQNIGEVRRAMFAAYPALLRDAGVGGTVRVYFFIDEQGEVQDTRIDQSSGHAAIDEAALGVADVFRFSAALNGDEPVPARVSHSLTFEVR
jgi:TonB family protein